MIGWIIGGIIVLWIFGVGVIGAIWEDRHNYVHLWYSELESTLFVIFWFITIPVFAIYMIGRLIVYFIFCIFDAIKSKRRRRRR